MIITKDDIMTIAIYAILALVVGGALFVLGKELRLF